MLLCDDSEPVERLFLWWPKPRMLNTLCPQIVDVSLCWPPVPEGILVEREDYREYFVWARNQSEAKTRSASLKPISSEY